MFASISAPLRRRARAVQLSPAAPWIALAVGCSLALLVLGVALFAVQRSARQQRDLTSRIALLSGQIVARESALKPASADKRPEAFATDFTRRLPIAPDMRSLLTELERSTTDAGIALGSIQHQDHPASAEQLARIDVTVSLRGSYPKLKLVVSDVLRRFPGVTLSQWRARRTIQPDDLDSTIVFALWGGAAQVVPPTSAVVMPAGQGAR